MDWVMYGVLIPTCVLVVAFALVKSIARSTAQSEAETEQEWLDRQW